METTPNANRKDDIQEKVEEILEQSIEDEQQAEIVRMRFTGKTLSEIAARKGISEESVGELSGKRHWPFSLLAVFPSFVFCLRSIEVPKHSSQQT